MQLEKSIIDHWKLDLDYSLPGLLETIQKQQSQTFLIGACVFDLYLMQQWIEDFSRRTGDVDFTIEYLGDPSEYNSVTSDLVISGYKKDHQHPYRFHPAKRRGSYAYVDFLAFTTCKGLEPSTRTLMNVGDHFNFQGMNFAKHRPLHLNKNIYLPNPLALIYLKMQSYYHAPDRRKKDFVDLIELVLRLTTKSIILNKLQIIISEFTDQSIHQQLKKMCKSIENDHTGPWDIDDVSEQIKERNLCDLYTEADIRQHFEYFRIRVLEPT